MAEALVIRVGDLLPEFLADALIVLRALQTAGAIPPGAFQPLPDGLNHFLILVQTNRHTEHIPSQ